MSVSFPSFLGFDSLPAPHFSRGHIFLQIFVFHKTLVYQYKKQRSPSLSSKHFTQKYLEKENFKKQGNSSRYIMYPEVIATTAGSEITVPTSFYKCVSAVYAGTSLQRYQWCILVNSSSNKDTVFPDYCLEVETITA